MFQKIKKIVNLISNMGLRYLFFRIFYTIKTKLGWLKKTFPRQPKVEEFVSLENWRKKLPPFFFYGKDIPNLPKVQTEILLETFKEIEKGVFTFFNKSKIDLSKDFNWLVNPSTGYEYDIKKHWSEVQELSEDAGDIKYVWEKARFSFLYDIIRYDYHFEEDQSKFVFNQIISFIDENPINQGPNYKCSQEISLRVLNWTFALYYYKDSKNLSEEIFQKIMHNIYWQIHHVYYNIHFSRISVRNNHAITETLMLYLSDKLFPFFPNVENWSRKGKKWFEQEIKYQIYEDGTFLQFSMNYHRVVIQLLTWGIQLANLNDDTFNKKVYDRAQKSLDFLDACSDPVTGNLPNYGANDGALFFKLTNDDYRVYTSQLDDLRAVLNGHTYTDSKSSFWYGVHSIKTKSEKIPELNTFSKGGYYIIQDGDTKTFLKCGAYKDRPVQSDNLHLDLWVNGINYLRDTGSYKYNTSKELLNFFNGCQGHNTISVSKENQSLKGGRFIWYNWVKFAKARLKKTENIFEFEGTIKAFSNLGRNIYHTRKLVKKEGEHLWNIEDQVINIKNRKIYQYWHLNPKYLKNIVIEAKDQNGKVLNSTKEKKWYSSYYGVKEESIMITFVTDTSSIFTQIKIIN